MKKESYHNVTFPNLAVDPSSLGLSYIVFPARHPETNEPIKYETEMDSAYLIKIGKPAHFDVLDEKEIDEYTKSPIREGEYAFCKFYNDSWHLGFQTFPLPFEFYLSSKVGPGEYGQNANEFMEKFDNQFAGKTLISTLYLKQDGTPIIGSGGCNKYEIYRDEKNNLFLKIGNSQPKEIFYTTPHNTYEDDNWFLVIKNIRGYAHGKVLENIKSTIVIELHKHNIEPKKIPWYEL